VTGARLAQAPVDLEQVSLRAVEVALSAGADDAEAWSEESTGRQIRVYQGAVESLTDATSRGLGVRAFSAGRVGYASGTDLSAGGIAALASAAHAAAVAVDVDEHQGLPEQCGATPVEGLSSSDVGSWPTERKVDLAVTIERVARAHPAVSQVEDAVYADEEERIALANSSGFCAAYERTSAWAYASAFAGEGSELMTGQGIGTGRGPAALDPAAIGCEAAERAAALTGARKPASRHCPVLLDAFVAAAFIGYIGAMLSADAVQRGRSPFADREGDEIATAALQLADDGVDPAGLASAPFDGEGSARRRTPLIEGGRLRTFLFDARSARKAGRATTSNASRRSYRSPPSVGPANLVVEPGTAPFDDLVARTGNGLYVTDVAGLHSGVNPVSGTFSVGASGRLVEGGELAGPVRQFTIASDLVSMLRAVAAVGSESRWVPFGGSVRAAPVLLAEMAVSGS